MIALVTALVPLVAAPGDVHAQAEIPSVYMQGESFPVKLVYSADGADAKLEGWKLGPGAFDLDGKPLAERAAGSDVALPAGAKLTLELDLAPYLKASKSFSLGVAGAEPQAVTMLQLAPKETKFLDLSPADLAQYQVVMKTDQGDMVVEFYPNEAPNHVKNFLDLCATGFYEGTGFHRVSPTFMIQGGCPKTKTDDARAWGTGDGPRTLNSEFNKIHHARGILSMARSQSPNSASSQFFVITKDSGFLDNQYSVFGKLVSGLDTLDKIANSKGKAGQDGTVKPDVLPRILKTYVVLAGKK